MKSPKELAASILTSPDEQKRQAVALRRLAGGVRAAAERKEHCGLTDKEVRTLLDAVTVLNELANRHTKAQKLKQAEYDARAAAERLVRTEMSKNFLALSDIPDQVAFIAAVSSNLLRDGRVKTIADLKYYFDDCINSLSYRFSTDATTKSPKIVVADAWEKFEEARAGLKEKQTAVIGRLLMASEHQITNK